jgi:phosphoenolpyruvate synthase/pyruvate phosphate dikinase
VSHAAVVARGMGTPAICGAEALDIDLARQEFRVTADREVGGVVSSITTTVQRGDVISINGSTGEVGGEGVVDVDERPDAGATAHDRSRRRRSSLSAIFEIQLLGPGRRSTPPRSSFRYVDGVPPRFA